MAWLEPEDLDDWTEVVDYTGEAIGYLRAKDARKLGFPVIVIETPKRYLEDPYVLYHAKLANERGLFKRGGDLNDVQITLLASHLIRRSEGEELLRKRSFEENMLINNPDLFKTYSEQKRREEEITEDTMLVEERVPQNVEEFLAALASLNDEEEGLDSDKEQEGEGWLTSILDSDSLQELGD